MATVLRQPDTGEPIYYTADMVDALNEAAPERLPKYECVYGELFVTVNPPRPWHATLVLRLYDALRAYTSREPAAGFVGIVQSKFTFRRPDVNVDPDVWVTSAAEWRAQDWEAVTTPLLLAEVLSRSTSRRDRFNKRLAYMHAGVPLYWIVDGDRRQVEVWTPGADFPRMERERLAWHPEGAHEPFTLALAELFAPV